MLPQNIEAEQAVLSAILIDNRTLPEVLELLQSADFYKEAHVRIFDSVISLFSKREPVDLVTVHRVLKDKAQLEDCVGVAYPN